MQLCDLIIDMSLAIVRGEGRCIVTDLTDDSRQVTAGCVFVARQGEVDDGQRFIAQAVARGAVAIISQHPPDDSSITWVQSQHVDQALVGRLAERFFGHPSKKLKLIGITGTNGKTTTAYIIQYLLQNLQTPCGLIGTITIDDGASQQPAALTTPGAIDLSRLLARMVDHGCKAAVLEVSSHALKQGRTAALQFDAAVFTNLTGDHLDYHHSMDDYLAAKAMLFEQLDQNAIAIVNADDAHHARIVAASLAPVKLCSLKRDDVAYSAKALTITANGSKARFIGPWAEFEANLPLIGEHNLYNALEALAAVHEISPIGPAIANTLEHCPPVPGRLELVPGPDHAPTVLVDYAHTHDALENVLAALRHMVQKKSGESGESGARLMVLFGCGGDRDRTKRPRMAKVACRLADMVMITSDNPRTEDPAAIIDDILQGAHDDVIVEPDRAKAIAKIIASANPDDVVLLAGKGHEDYQIIGTQKQPFDDKEHATAALNCHNNHGDTETQRNTN